MIRLKIPELDNKKILLLALACLFVFYLDYSLFIQLQRKHLNQINAKIVKVNKDLDALTKDLLNMQQLMSKSGGLLNKKFISEEGLPGLLENIYTISNKNEVKIMQMTPSKEAKAQASLKDLSIGLDLFAEFNHIANFINDLENAEVFIAVGDLKITSTPTDYLRQKVSLVLRTYVRK